MSDIKSINLGFWPNLGVSGLNTKYVFQLHIKKKRIEKWYHIVLKSV